METTHEEFKNIAQGIQAILISFAAIIGSAWAIMRFKYTKEKERAEFELDKIKTDILKARGIIIGLEADCYFNSIDYDVVVKVKLENHTGKVRLLILDGHPIIASKLVSTKKGNYKYNEVARSGIVTCAPESEYDCKWITSITLIPNTPNEFHIPLRIKEPGIYAISLILRLDKSMKDFMRLKEDRNTEFKARRHLKIIREKNNQPHTEDQYVITERIINIEGS